MPPTAVNVLGIWDGHDSGAALLQEGRLRFAVNEERLTRRKLEVRFPDRSIEACLAYAGLDAGAGRSSWPSPPPIRPRRWADGGPEARSATTRSVGARPGPALSPG